MFIHPFLFYIFYSNRQFALWLWYYQFQPKNFTHSHNQFRGGIFVINLIFIAFLVGCHEQEKNVFSIPLNYARIMHVSQLFLVNTSMKGNIKLLSSFPEKEKR